MRFVDEYRQPAAAKRLAHEIARLATRSWTIMEVCGGQTHAIVKFGIDQLLPETISLLHGPGCPVCVTPVDLIDKALELASRPGLVFCSFGDMLRVPGSTRDLLGAKAAGADVRVVYSPLDALRVAGENPDREVVFFAVGFETTAPATATAVYRARREDIRNFSMLVAHVLIPPAMDLILRSPHNCVQGFLAAGHVCTVTGCAAYETLARTHGVPIVVTGFEPLDILQGIHMCVRQLEQGRAEVENQYVRSVREGGNVHARALIDEVFEVVPRRWRGIGEIPRSGLGLREPYAAWDAQKQFEFDGRASEEPSECISGQILQGRMKPCECPAFAVRCTPQRPLGATMVSSEGTCAAYYRYRHTSGGA